MEEVSQSTGLAKPVIYNRLSRGKKADSQPVFCKQRKEPSLMNEQIYTLLNEIDNQPDSYEIPQVSDLEMKKWKKQFSSRRVFRRSRKKYVAAAAIVCILGGSLLFPPAQFIAYAGMKTVTYNLSQLLGIQKDLSPYRTMVGKSISKDGYTVTLNDVVL